MIVYFADRTMKVLGSASTWLPSGLIIKEDKKIEEIETGLASFEGRIPYTQETRQLCEQLTAPGNFVLRSHENENEFYTIINSELDTDDMEVYFYAEDAGLDLLNEVAIKIPDGPNDEFTFHEATFTEWINLYISETGWEIGRNASADDSTTVLPKDAKVDSEATVTERLKNLATLEKFGYEISYSFEMAPAGFELLHKYINIDKKRGNDTGVQLRLNKEINKITTTKTIENVVTSLLIYGSNDVTLDPYVGRTYEDGEYVIANQYFAERELTHACLQSMSALSKWGRQANGEVRHITKPYSVDSENLDTIVQEGIKELKKLKDMEINYEVDIADLPESVRIGDYVYIVDEVDEMYLQARVLKLEVSVSDKKHVATLGDYLIKSGGISETVRELASQFERVAGLREFYTWIAYADDIQGTNISTAQLVTSKYMGIAVNRASETVDISDPSIFEWTVIEGGNPLMISIESTQGTFFSTTKVITTLIAHVFYDGVEVAETEISNYGVLKWYKDGNQTPIYFGRSLNIVGADNVDAGRYEVRLETN